MQSNWLRQISKTYSQLNEFFIPNTQVLTATQKALDAVKNYDGSFGGGSYSGPRQVAGDTGKPGAVAIRQRAKEEGITPQEARAASNQELLASRGDGSFGGNTTGPVQRQVPGNANILSQPRQSVSTPEGKTLSIIPATPANRTGQFGGRNFAGPTTVAGNAPSTPTRPAPMGVAQRTRESMDRVDKTGPRRPMTASERLAASKAAEKTVAARKAARGIQPTVRPDVQTELNSLRSARAPQSTVYGPERHWSRSQGLM